MFLTWIPGQAQDDGGWWAVFGLNLIESYLNHIVPISIKRSRHYAVFNPKHRPGFTLSRRAELSPNRRAGLDPASAAGSMLLTWIPGRAREDGGGRTVLGLNLIESYLNRIVPTSIKRSRHYAVFNPKRHVGLSPVVVPDFPPIVVPDLIRHLLQVVWC